MNESITIPFRISEYIRQHFGEEFLTDIKSFRNRNGQPFFNVDIAHESTLYHLKFNYKGVLVERKTEPLIEMDEEAIDDIE